jgi:hypothetical protein
MKARVLVLAGCMVFAGAAAAQADCAGEIAKLSGHGGGISKDGSLAPLEGAGTDSAGAAEQAAPSPDGAIAKDGGDMPLEGTGGATQGAAMSQQDAEAQQQGGSTAAEAAAAASGGGGDALQRAQAALAAGDEAGCMQAVEEARRQAG